ncbi:MAG: hypothetical protein E6Q24_09975 [Chitinophagaceae bacterium]|nr:MAG: hypothetical protein E6Q24_09975 [Chitinophagaceae bacterium]
MKQVQRWETQALIFFKPVSVLNLVRGDKGKGTTGSTGVFLSSVSIFLSTHQPFHWATMPVFHTI